MVGDGYYDAEIEDSKRKPRKKKGDTNEEQEVGKDKDKGRLRMKGVDIDLNRKKKKKKKTNYKEGSGEVDEEDKEENVDGENDKANDNGNYGAQDTYWSYEGVGSASRVTGVTNHHLRTPDGALLNCVVFENDMDEQTYQEQLESGIWRRTDTEHLKRRKEEERQERIKRDQVKRAHKAAKARREEQERQQRQDEIDAKRELSSRIRQDYENAWIDLTSSILESGGSDLNKRVQPSAIPWPVNPGVSKIDKKSVSEFLLGTLDVHDVVLQKQVLRTAVLAYHPDRFNRILERLDADEEVKTAIKEKSLWVSQILNELLSTAK